MTSILKSLNAGKLLAILSLATVVGCGPKHATSTRPLDDQALAQRKLVLPEAGLYTGAYIDFGDKEDGVTLERIERFEQMVGKHQAIIASSSYWGEAMFPEANMRLIARHGAVPLVFWSPWDKPYVEGLGPDKFSLLRIIAGEHDGYIDMWADKARQFGAPMIVSFANEMNGAWFPWSGIHYGGQKRLAGRPEKSPAYEGPETFKAAWRHVVDRVRSRGATNIQWVFHLMNYSMPMDSWNMAPQYYPGPNYCDWLGISLYGSQFPGDDKWADFLPCYDWPYSELSQLDPTKPIMLCEWGVGELPHLGNKADWFRDGFRTMKDPKYARTKAIVYWHERWQNSEGENNKMYSNLRVNSTPESLEAYRRGVSDPFYIGAPRFVPK